MALKMTNVYNVPGYLSELHDLGQSSLAGNYAGQANAYRYPKETDEEQEARIKKEEEERVTKEQEKQQQIDKAIKFFVSAIVCLGFTVFVIAANANLRVHDYNTALASSVLWGLGIAGVGFTLLLSVLGFTKL